jgi:hypothetical protein
MLRHLLGDQLGIYQWPNAPLAIPTRGKNAGQTLAK